MVPPAPALLPPPPVAAPPSPDTSMFCTEIAPLPGVPGLTALRITDPCGSTRLLLKVIPATDKLANGKVVQGLGATLVCEPKIDPTVPVKLTVSPVIVTVPPVPACPAPTVVPRWPALPAPCAPIPKTAPPPPKPKPPLAP